MKKFVDKTTSNQEPAVKAGNFIPSDAVNLGWFSSSDITPGNNLISVDFSNLIKENINEKDNLDRVMYANEVGILEDENGNSGVEGDAFYISDIFLNERISTDRYTIDELDEVDYCTSYYVSTGFTLVKSNIYISTNTSSFTDQKFISDSIKVIDSNGNLYADQETGRKKYRIELESFITESNKFSNDVPARIIVLLEDPDLVNYKLVYDKVDCDRNGIWSNQILRYSETINSIPIFEKVEEEVEVVDPSNFGSKIFSVKRDSKKYLLDNFLNGSDTKKIYASKKALSDNRNFEIFNWRLVGKISSSVNVSEINYGNFDTTEVKDAKVTKVGVLYSSKSSLNDSTQSINTYAKPYVFYNLEKSAFNIAKLSFENPYAKSNSKIESKYWLVDIDTLKESEIAQYDLLACSLYWKLTPEQSQLINNFVKKYYGSLIIDLENAPDLALKEYLGNSLTVVSDNTNMGSSISEFYNENNIFNDINKTNAFELSENEFAADCGIYGYAKNGNFYTKYNYINTSDFENVISVQGTFGPNPVMRPIIVSQRHISPGDSHKASNVVISTSGFLSYANNIYPIGSKISNPNNGETAITFQDESAFSFYSERTFKVSI